MNMTTLLGSLDEAHRELAICLENCPSDDLWRRPHPGLLSVGEIAGHVATAQTLWMIGEAWDADLASLEIQSPLIDARFKYYVHSIKAPVSVDLTADQAIAEVARIHQAARAKAAEHDAGDPTPTHWETWGNMVQYQGFHVAYHAGQIYSVRHMMGHETEDN
ncbi:MAG: DinB family protein [Fimbriimonadaceae bacterium]|nr:DinB family protein [Fimbriimonadaceae bacterium]